MADAEINQVDRIIGRALLTAEAIIGELRIAIIDAVVRDEPLAPLLTRYVEIHGELLSDAELAAWIAGHVEVTRSLGIEGVEALSVPGGPVTAPIFGGTREPLLRFPALERAAEELTERNIVLRSVFDQLRGELRDRAFTVARLDTEDAVAAVRDALQENLREGPSLEGFRELVEEKLGASRLGPAHLETVYRTNIQTQFTRGFDSMASDPVVVDVLPYREYLAIRDDRVREKHLALESLGLSKTAVYRSDDPFWETFRIPWDYNCRCGSNLLSVEAAAAKGVAEAKEWLQTGIRPQMVSRLPDIPFRPPRDFR